MAVRVGINGFGRIGRCVVRAWLESGRRDIEIVHVNDLGNLAINAHLLKYDSVHGTFKHPVAVEGDKLRVSDYALSFSASRDPKDIPWGANKVDIVMDCTGAFTEAEKAKAHLQGGAKKVLISAPAKGEDITIVKGVNCELLDAAKHTIVSNGSCTTNCLAPVAKVIHENFRIVKGLMTTVHSYTNDQQVLDASHKDLRRARAAAVSMIPTTTGAAKALALVLPELKGKMDGMSIRVPTPNVSVVDVTFEVEKSTSKEEVNAILKKASETSLKGILGYTDEPLVSCDFNGNSLSSIIDASVTTVLGGNMVKILSWYDNETGFSHRMLDVAAKMI